jgi:HK97 family phage portal protein
MSKKAYLQQFVNTYLWGSNERSLENPNSPITTVGLFGGEETKAGAVIDGNSALALSAYTRANQVLADTMATLPVNVHKKNTDGSTTIVDHVVSDLFKLEPNDIQTAVNWRSAGQGGLNTYGNTFSEIFRKGDGSVKNIGVPFDDSQVEVKVNDGRIVYNVTENGSNRTIQSRDMYHVLGFSYNGVVGIAKLNLMKETLGLSKTYEDKASAFIRNDSTPPVALIGKSKMDEAQKKANKENWQAANSGKNAGKAAVLTGEWDIKQLAITPDQAQFLQSRVFSVGEIARFTGVPPHILFELERSTFNNIEQQNIEFVTYTLLGWVNRWEQEANRKLFKPSERKTHFLKFNLNGLLKADAKSRGEFYKALASIGALMPNDVRKFEDMNPINGGDKAFVQMQDISLAKYDEYLDSVIEKGSEIKSKKEDGQ